MKINQLSPIRLMINLEMGFLPKYFLLLTDFHCSVMMSRKENKRKRKEKMCVYLHVWYIKLASVL